MAEDEKIRHQVNTLALPGFNSYYPATHFLKDTHIRLAGKQILPAPGTAHDQVPVIQGLGS